MGRGDQGGPVDGGQQPYKAIIEKDPAFFEGVASQEPAVVEALLAAFGRSWAGTTPAEFDAQVRDWLVTVKQPKLGVLYKDLVYKPMLELFDLLKQNGFRVFVCSGGGRDFMRVFAEETWGINKENVIGTAAEYTYVDGGVVRGEEMLGSLDLGPGKPEHIFAQTGRLPVFAGGTPTWTSRCSSRLRSASWSAMTTRTVSSPTPPRPRRRWPGPRSWAGPS